jgi:outer membrane lipoprotein-sorting protein
MKKTLIVIIVLILIGIGVWFLFGNEKENGEEGTVSTDDELSLTDILGKTKDITSFKYDMVVTIPGETAVTTKMWRKGDKTKTEMAIEGQKMIYLMDIDKQLAYTYFPSENTAMKMDLSNAQEVAGESPTEQSESIMDYTPETVGTEVLDGKTCLVVKYTIAAAETKMWFWTKHGFPIKTETATADGTTIMELKNIDFGDISDSVFELPVGVQITTIPSFGF